MIPISVKLFAVALLSTIGTVVGTTNNAPDLELDQISRYRQWTRVKQKLTIAPGIDINSATGAV